MTDDKDKAPEPTVGNITDINEFAAKKYDEMKLEELRKQHEFEQNFILSPLWEALTSIKSSKQAINAAMGMLITAKDILVLEVGKEQAKTIFQTMDYDKIDLVTIVKKPEDGKIVEEYQLREEDMDPMEAPLEEDKVVPFKKGDNDNGEEESTD
jgi:hypothetical protein|tara:strand:- start:8894 stop:9355 length:462 start_codon:yes stop_codon:yes gene_type:complete